MGINMRAVGKISRPIATDIVSFQGQLFSVLETFDAGEHDMYYELRKRQGTLQGEYFLETTFLLWASKTKNATQARGRTFYCSEKAGKKRFLDGFGSTEIVPCSSFSKIAPKKTRNGCVCSIDRVSYLMIPVCSLLPSWRKTNPAS